MAALADAFPADIDEYDPLRPNDYADVLAARRARAEDEARERKRRRGEEAPSEHGGGAVDESASPSPAAVHSAPTAALAAVTSRGAGRGVSNLPAWMASSGGGSVPGPAAPGPGEAPPPGAGSAPAAGGGSKPLSLGARLLAKMGYQEGKGLGKDGSGLLAPLVHEKTGLRSGVIREAAGAGAAAPPEPAPSPAASGGGGGAPTFLSTVSPAGAPAAPPAAPPPPSRVVLLTNMVGPGEVDDDLEGEVRDECAARYGPVEAVYVFEVAAAPGGGAVPREEAVRIVVAFREAAAAAAAQRDLSARFFGGHAVRASFFPEDRFARLDFAP